jgi:hypothetical protein
VERQNPSLRKVRPFVDEVDFGRNSRATLGKESFLLALITSVGVINRLYYFDSL